MKGVLVFAALVFALMLAIKDGRVLRKAGLTGFCTAVSAPAGESGAWQRCTPGKLQGAPDLSRQGCTSVSAGTNVAYWRCPTQIENGPR